ncbi:MAG: hypothetical protein ABI056_07335 [Caulobacteraceae bacterium]
MTTSTAVIRKAVALARIAARNTTEDGRVTFLDKQGEKMNILLKS